MLCSLAQIVLSDLIHVLVMIHHAEFLAGAGHQHFYKSKMIDLFVFHQRNPTIALIQHQFLLMPISSYIRVIARFE